MTTASETPPAKERSKPPCWTTSSCPRPTMAMIAAKGRLPDRAPQVTLEGASSRQARISAAVETAIVRKLLARGTAKRWRRAGNAVALLGAWFIDHSSTSPDPYGRTLAAENMSKASVKDRTEF